jgi:hypothetical protein
MTVEQYLSEYLERDADISGTSIRVYKRSVAGKGEVVVEYSPETDKADIIHTSRDNRSNFYEASDAKELKDVIEYCLGPVVSDKDWNTCHSLSNTADDTDYEDEY